MSEAHLWEADHPYYASEGNYYKTGEHTLCDSWQEFIETMGQSDPDLNLLYRWDWNRPESEEDQDEDLDDVETLSLFFMMQRKARCLSYAVRVTPEDEPAVRAWLTFRAETIRAIWAPII